MYHTRAMRQSLLAKFGRMSPTVQPAVLGWFYRDLTGDSCASLNLGEAEIDSRVRQVLDMEPEDPQTVIDLRNLNSSVERAKHDVFWDHCSQYLNESACTAVDDRRCSEVVHMAQAISIRNLRDQVQLRCPEGALVPSLSGSGFSSVPWLSLLRLQRITLAVLTSSVWYRRGNGGTIII